MISEKNTVFHLHSILQGMAGSHDERITAGHTPCSGIRLKAWKRVDNPLSRSFALK